MAPPLKDRRGRVGAGNRPSRRRNRRGGSRRRSAKRTARGPQVPGSNAVTDRMTTVFLVASEHDIRGELILSALRQGGKPVAPDGDTAGIRHPATPEVARADVAAAPARGDPGWPAVVGVLLPAARFSAQPRGAAGGRPPGHPP